MALAQYAKIDRLRERLGLGASGEHPFPMGYTLAVVRNTVPGLLLLALAWPGRGRTPRDVDNAIELIVSHTG